MKRTFKQLIYGLFYLACWTGIFLVIYNAFLKPAPSCFDNIQNQGEEGIDCGGPCAKVCTPGTLQPIAGGVSVFPLGSPSSTQQAISLLANIKNPNSDFAARSFSYAFGIYDANGNSLATSSGDSFVYAQEIKYIAVPRFSLPSGAKADHAIFTVSDPVWAKASDYLPAALRVQNFAATVSGNNISVSGNLTNEDNVVFARVTALSVFYDGLGKLTGVSETELENVAPNETRAFTILHPPIPSANLAATQVFVYAARP